jgi:hypothetical protein
MAKTAAKKARARSKPKQERLDGMPGGAKHPDISKAAEVYVAHRDERMEATKTEVETRDALILKMKEHGITVYRDPDSDLLVTLIEGKTKVKVKKAGEDEEGEDDAENEE